MKLRKNMLCGFLFCMPFLACDLGDGSRKDPQFVRIQLNYGFRNAVNTFEGTLTKDLIMDGSITVPFWFATAEQQLIVAELERAGFYDLPDTIHPMAGVSVDPNPGPIVLRVGGDRPEKTVVLFYPPDRTGGSADVIEELGQVIWSIVQATPEYKQLPPVRGAYL